MALVLSGLRFQITVDVHTERQSERIDDLSEFIERLAAEVTEREQIALVLPNEFRNVFDVRGAQAVLRADRKMERIDRGQQDLANALGLAVRDRAALFFFLFAAKPN